VVYFWLNKTITSTTFLTGLLVMLCIALLGTGSVTISPSQVLLILASSIGLISVSKTGSVIEPI